MSPFLSFLSTYLSEKPLDIEDMKGHSMEGLYLDWVFLLKLCREHGEEVKYEQRCFQALHKDKSLSHSYTFFHYGYLKFKEGLCLGRSGPLFIEKEATKIRQNILDATKLQGHDVEIEDTLIQEEPDYIANNTLSFPPVFQAW